MDFSKIIKPIIYGLLGLIGIVFIATPYTNYEEAYFVDEDYYITMCDSIEVGYKPYIEDKISSERNHKALLETKKYILSIKPISDSLQFARSKAKVNGDTATLAEIEKAIEVLTNEKFVNEAKISEKYSIDKMDKAELDAKMKSITDTLSMEDYIVVVEPNKKPR